MEVEPAPIKEVVRVPNAIEDQTVVYTFGYGKHGQLGHGLANDAPKPSPMKIGSLQKRMIVQVSCGGAFSAALSTYGDVYTWGDARGAIPTKNSQLRGKLVKKIGTMAMNTLALTEDGKVYMWGEAYPDAKGTEKRTVITNPCSLKGGVLNKVVVDFACGALHSLLLCNDREVYALGSNGFGQLGEPQVRDARVPICVEFLKDKNIVAISCGGAHSAALSENGDLWAWGSSKYGQLGTGDYKDSPLPLKVRSFLLPCQIACGDYHTLVVSNGKLFSFGQGKCGQLGLCSNFSNQPVPTQVDSLIHKKCVRVAAGGGFGCSHSMVLTEDGLLYAFGSGKNGQLGFSLPPPLVHTGDPTLLEKFRGKQVIDFGCGWLHSMVLCGNVPKNLSDIGPILTVGGLRGDPAVGNLDVIPNDILLFVLWHLDAKTLLCLGCCSTFFQDFTSDRTIWMLLCQTDLGLTQIDSTAMNWRSRYIEELNRQHGRIGSLSDVHQIVSHHSASQGGWFSSFGEEFKKKVEYVFKKKEARVLILGLDASGKTTILYKMKLGSIVTTIPTIGFNVETIPYKNVSFTCWDVGGPDKIRPLWRHYYQNTSAIIFVVDSNDRDRIHYSREDLQMLLSEEEIRDAVILVFANKQDLPNAMSVTEITEALGLNNIRTHAWYVQGCAAVTGYGLFEGFQWLTNVLFNK